MITLLTRHKMPECLCGFWDNPTNTPGSLPRGARAPVLPSRVPRAASRLEPDPPFCSIQLFHQHQPLSKTNFWCTQSLGEPQPSAAKQQQQLLPRLPFPDRGQGEDLSAPVLPDRFALLSHIAPAAEKAPGRSGARPEAIRIAAKAFQQLRSSPRAAQHPPARICE